MTTAPAVKLELADDAGPQEVAPTPSVPPVVSSNKEPKTLKLEEEDRLRVANEHLLVENCNLQIRLLENDLAAAKKARADHWGKLLTLRSELSVKYGLDFTKLKVREDGTIVSPEEGAPDMGALMALLRNAGG